MLVIIGIIFLIWFLNSGNKRSDAYWKRKFEEDLEEYRRQNPEQ